METRHSFRILGRVQIKRLLVLIISIVGVLVVLSQVITLRYTNYTSILSPVTNNNTMVHEVTIYDINASSAYEGTLNNSKVEVGFKGYDLDARNVSNPNLFELTVPVSSEPTQLSYMISVLESAVAASSRKSKLSARDRELQHVRMQIENAPTVRSTGGLHASLYRNISKFLRSYKLMENTFKVYVYKDGKKPIFHDPKLRGIYASEGWFMKLIEKNRNFITKDPQKAHLFYLPFSSLKLRNMSRGKNIKNHKDLEQHLKNYTDLIAGKYPFWNRTNGADHFLVACHDWAMKLTKEPMGNCIRSLCNSNLAGGFRIGKDTTLPATYIQTAEDPVKDLAGNPPEKRPILAFFAGGLHGNLRPVLIHHWHDKEADIKISGPMARDNITKSVYRTYMKSSKYCICARGYEVYSPRIVESIYYECVPVIISDNYVPPFMEVLDWAAFCVFVLEKDVVNLSGILRAIPEKRYRKMQERVKMVQRHFIWHKKPVRFDLFHMILHSVWYSRVFSGE